MRCALLKQLRQLSYEELAFHLEDSASFRAFARLPLTWSPKKSVLHQTISAIRAPTWEAINQALLVSAPAKLESGAAVRIDSTVSEALMHPPSDSTLLWDAARVMTRLLRQAKRLPEVPAVRWRDRRRLAKKRARAIDYSRGQDKKRQLYHELIAAAQATEGELQAVAKGLVEIVGTVASGGAPKSIIIGRWSRASSSSASAGFSKGKRCRPARSWSVCSNRTPTSS